MSFSEEWDISYKNSRHLSIWPWSDLVSYVMRYAQPGQNSNVLELGVGAGANIPFFLSLNTNYFCIEGSESIVNLLKNKYPELKERIVVSDFTKAIPFDHSFDLIMDRSSLTHNSTNSIKNCLKILSAKLNDRGIFIGIDWFSTEYSEYQQGFETEDFYTKTFLEGPFSNLGKVHFSDKEHLLNLFEQFEIIVLEHKIVKREIPDSDFQLASWNFVARKR